MSRIEASSRKITEIVGLIQEIAFQTNLLALNASVEAARAGEAGRGFAVVANEVRALAQRAAAASKDIKELIVNSDNQVQEGVKLVGEAGASLEQIVSSVKKVADYVSEIASASQEQTSGIEQVSAAISGMDEMTQQNASLVEETTGAIQSASGQVIELQQTVGFFRTTQNRQPDKRPADKVDNSGQSLDEPLRDIARKMAEQAKPVDEKRNPPANLSTSKRAAAAAIAVPVDGDWEEF
jgi:methyl-accepting chemotaxis protein